LSLDFSLFLPLDFSLLNEMENYKLEHLWTFMNVHQYSWTNNSRIV
jgi:hypothetical protein